MCHKCDVKAVFVKSKVQERLYGQLEIFRHVTEVIWSQPSPEEYIRGKSSQSYLQYPVFMIQIQPISTWLIMILCVTLSHLFRKYDNELNFLLQ